MKCIPLLIFAHVHLRPFFRIISWVVSSQKKKTGLMNKNNTNLKWIYILCLDWHARVIKNLCCFQVWNWNFYAIFSNMRLQIQSNQIKMSKNMDFLFNYLFCFFFSFLYLNEKIHINYVYRFVLFAHAFYSLTQFISLKFHKSQDNKVYLSHSIL